MTGANLYGNEEPVIELKPGALPPILTQNNVEAAVVEHDGQAALDVQYTVVDWPNVFFKAPDAPWDWSGHVGLAIDVYNPEPQTVQLAIRVDNAGGDGASNCITISASALPGATTTVRAQFRSDSGPFWGMRGIPEQGPVAAGGDLDPSRVTAFQVFLPRPSKPHRLIISNIRVYGKGGDVADLVPMPFVDKFGQYVHADWPGKVHSEKELAAARDSELAGLDAAPRMAGRDRFGGWADGPALEATGWFRTERVNGAWWLVTPEGRLFLSFGMDCVGTWQQTFIEKREPWFEWLPEADSGDPLAGFLGQVSGAHSGADPVNGEGRTYSFYCANLMRRYGENWSARWRDTTYARLRDWGFNTVANWSQQDVLDNSTVPFVVSASVGGDLRRIDAGGGYWSALPDVYDPGYAEAVVRSVTPTSKRYGSNPLCIGYFVDNEASWHGVTKGTLASPPDQPCRIAQIDQLKAKYGSLEKLNEAWGADAADWDGLRIPAERNGACQEDLDAFEYAFARRYFELVRDALKQHAPNHLYLGCRFSGHAPEGVMRACADVADVVSFNLYYNAIPPEEFTGDKDLGKPLVIGEFHFGALDRGMFHTGLVGTANQAERASSYATYVRSVVESPAFVGCHWFQYVDEPNTGRWFDGENYNIGFVNVVDVPYPELVGAAKSIHRDAYAIRAERFPVR
ncbi:MAG: hypothetical protein GY851_32765 [bacterium]|nr:hypothetical protein [bacterium]